MRSYREKPTTAYGQSKLAAEEAVLEAGIRYGMHVVNLRLTMVYGSGARGNLLRMGDMIQQLKLLYPTRETIALWSMSMTWSMP